MGLNSKVMRTFADRTVVCPRCWRQNPAGVAFCADCGSTLKGAAAADDGATVLAMTAELMFKEPEKAAPGPSAPATVPCAHCAAQLPATARFCHSCGKAVAAPAQRDPGATAPIGGFDLAIGRARPRLAVLNADGSLRKVWPIAGEVVLVGSREGDVLLERDETIAPRHGRIRLDGGRWVVEDLKTINGIYRRILGPEELSVGDYVRAGRQVFRVASYQELFGSQPPPLPSSQVKFLGSPVASETVVYLAQVLENRRVGHLLSLDERAPRVVGRQSGDLVLSGDEFLSGQHVRFEVRDGRCLVTDLKSTNGVYVRIAEPTPVVPGQLLLFGETLVRFEVG